MDIPGDVELHADSRATQTLAARRTTSPAPALSLSSHSHSHTTTTSPRRSANARRPPPPASPEIISSLIDQLAAISASATDHSHSHSRAPSLASLPATPAASTYAHSLSLSLSHSRSHSRSHSHSRHASTASHGPYYSAVRPQHDLGPDDACEPPVVRTSKPPSGKSPLTATPKRRDKPHSLYSYIGRSGSSASIRSSHSARSASSVGNASIDLPPAAAASTRSSAESKRSLKGHRSLLYMSSREQLRQREVDRKRLDDPGAPNSPGRNSVQLFAYEDTIKEEPLSREDHEAESSRFAQRYPERAESTRRIHLNLVDGPLEDTTIERGLVPDRGSSLKHSSSPTKKKSRRSSKSSHKDRHGAEKSGRTESPEKAMAMDKPEKSSKPHLASNEQQHAEALQKKEVPQSQTGLEERRTQTAPTTSEPRPLAKMDSDAAMKERLLMELEQEENEVAQRIRELREQKMRRDRIAGKMPAHSDALTTSDMPRVSTLTTPVPEPRPTSSPSLTTHEQTDESARLPGFLGTWTEEPAHSINRSKSTIAPGPGHSRHRSLTWNEGDDFTLVPFDYALALQTLEESAPDSPLVSQSGSGRVRSPPPSSGSIISDHSQSARVPVRRSNSLSVVSRSVLARPVSSARTLTITKHRPSLSVADTVADDRMLSARSASEENSTRLSVQSTASASNSFKNHQRRATKKTKRWSHPDLPAKAEKAHNAKVDRAEAVQRSQTPLVEERPLSQDSIGLEVDTYLNSPRLSQKIRHPQTGRVISFSEVGDPEGYAVFVCVGMGLTRFVMAFYDQLAVTLKLRLITPERPGVGSSEADPNGTPLSWADDVSIICQALKVTKFSLLAHSAGAIYALATSLRMPQHIRGRVHLLAPWIPPSQMAPIGISQDSPPTQQLPRSQRFLRALPASFLKVANSTFLSGTSASLQRTGPKTTPKKTRKSSAPAVIRGRSTSPQRPSLKDSRRESMLAMDQILPNASSLTLAVTNSKDPTYELAKQEALSRAERERQQAFDERLTFAIWNRATANANPATDLIVCLETRQTIGFRYEDINRPVVIHHGSKDSRVPVDNVRWLGKLMRKCEVRILEGEQHGLMASAQVMGNVLTEMASDWDNWTSIVQQRSISDLRSLARLRA